MEENRMKTFVKNILKESGMTVNKYERTTGMHPSALFNRLKRESIKFKEILDICDVVEMKLICVKKSKKTDKSIEC